MSEEKRIDVCRECSKEMYWSDGNWYVCSNEACIKYVKDEEKEKED